MKILIVEDEGIIALGMRLEFEKAGYECSVAVTGDGAVERSLTFHPDVVIMDIHLAGRIDGIESARRIKEACNAAIIFITGYDDAELKERATALHPAGYMVKPIDIEEIQSMLKNYAKHLA